MCIWLRTYAVQCTCPVGSVRSCLDCSNWNVIRLSRLKDISGFCSFLGGLFCKSVLPHHLRLWPMVSLVESIELFWFSISLYVWTLVFSKSEVGICRSIFLNETSTYANCLEAVPDLSNVDYESIYCCTGSNEAFHHYEYCCSYDELVAQHRWVPFSRHTH